MGKESVYSGVELREILTLAGVKFGKDLRGAAIGQFLVVEAADNYRAVFSLTELDPEFTDEVVILADLQDGKALSEKNGKYQVIVPKEKRHARWVRQVTTLRVMSVLTGDGASKSAAETKSASEEEIRFVVLSRVIKPWILRGDERDGSFYIGIDRAKDPDKSLLEKLRKTYGDLLRPASESFIDETQGSLVKDVKTKKHGVLFTVSPIEWISSESVEVGGGSYVANMSSGGCRFVLKREYGDWKIVSERCFIS